MTAGGAFGISVGKRKICAHNTASDSGCTSRSLGKEHRSIMNRRNALQVLAAGGTGMMGNLKPTEAVVAQSRRGLPPVKITDVKVFMTQASNHAVVVKVLTDEPGLYGVGCATHRERPLAVATAVEQYLKPFVVGRTCDEIEDIWQSAYVSSYFRSGVTLNNALSGVDGALWDILGKRCGVPVYKLLGGKVRAAAPVYSHARAHTLTDMEDQVRAWMEKGYRYVRCQIATPGFSGYGVSGTKTSEAVKAMRPDGVADSPVYEPTPYVNRVIEMFGHLRDKLGYDDVELLHDVHERVFPAQAVQIAKAVEPYRLFFLEDCFSPEDVEWFKILRPQTSTPLSMGELFVNRHEWMELVTNRLIDFIRCHISAIGGLSMARKIACCCEFFGVRTAWHGPGNVSPVGHAVNLHLDLASYNFGIQEQHLFSDAERELFPGTPEIRAGYLGVDIDEKLAKKYPLKDLGGSRGNDRRLDGTRIRP
jgi:mannonate dehydratase